MKFEWFISELNETLLIHYLFIYGTYVSQLYCNADTALSAGLRGLGPDICVFVWKGEGVDECVSMVNFMVCLFILRLVFLCCLWDIYIKNTKGKKK